MASGIYNRFKANLMNKVVDLEADTVYISLMSGGHSFTATDNVWTDVSDNEISGTGYTMSGSALASKSVTQAATTKWDATDVSWTTATFDTAHAVIWDDTVGTDDLICSIDFGGTQSVVAGTLTIQFDSNGIITLA